VPIQSHKAMDAITKLLDFALPPLSLLLFTILMPPSLIFKLLMHVRKSLRKENVANKVVLITGAASGIGEVCFFFFFLSLLEHVVPGNMFFDANFLLYSKYEFYFW